MATAFDRSVYSESPALTALKGYKPLTAPSLAAAVGGQQSVTKIPTNEPTIPFTGPDPSRGSELEKFGYTGDLGLNDYEQQYLNEITRLMGDRSALNALAPAQGYYADVLSGKYGAEGDDYLQGVLDPMKASAMQSYDELSKALATRYSGIGGFFGGRHGIAQGRLAADTANNMALNEANLRYQRYVDNLNAMGGAAAGLTGVSGQIAGLEDLLLGQIRGGGDLITGREKYNQEQYQGAADRSYNDWVRARAEQLLPYQLALALTGQPSVDNVVSQSNWLSDIGGILAGIGEIIPG